jgi:hypothetical protein
MSKSPSYKSHSRLRGLWPASPRWLLIGIALIIGLSACAPQPKQSIPATVSTDAPPTATTTQKLGPTPVIVSTSAAPAETETRLGFNVRGWT